MKQKITQLHLIKQFFKNNSNKNIAHPKAVDWLVKEWKKKTGKVFRDPDRGIRSLHEQGFLIKVKKGVYRYSSKNTKQLKAKNFSKAQKEKILKRDNYKCVICGLGKKEGLELHVDHIKPKNLGGKSKIKNGQTLCARHNFIKKNLKQTETGKKMFIRLYELAKEKKDKHLQSFCSNVLETYEKYIISMDISFGKNNYIFKNFLTKMGIVLESGCRFQKRGGCLGYCIR